MSDAVLRQLERAAATGDPGARARLAREVVRVFGPEVSAFDRALRKLLTQANARRRLFRVDADDVADSVARRARHRTHGDLRWAWADGRDYGEKPRIGWKAQGVSHSMGRSGLVHRHKVPFGGSPTTDVRTIVLYVVKGREAVLVASTAPREGPCALRLGSRELAVASPSDVLAAWFPGAEDDPAVRAPSLVVEAWAELAVGGLDEG